MNQQIPWEKLAEYFAGEMSGEEMEEMKIWIKSDPEREKKINALYQIWEESEQLPYKLDVDQAWGTLEDRMDESERVSSGEVHKIITQATADKNVRINRINRKVRNSGISQKIALIAASILIILTAGFFSHQYYLGIEEAQFNEEIVYEELTTRDGQRAVYTLNDGSRVTLHAGSRLQIPVNFNRNNRDLILEGEAYFEVASNPEIPFVVHSDNSYTRVLGTKFLLQAWPNEGRHVGIYVTEGSVAFGEKKNEEADSDSEVIIEQNEMAHLSAGNEPEVQTIRDLTWHLGWTEGRLVFENRKLSEILPRLERWYVVEIQTADSSIDEIRLTAEIDYSQPMMEVLTGIALSLDLEIEEGNRTYTFYSADDQRQ
jgi:transmembrane sensor